MMQKTRQVMQSNQQAAEKQQQQVNAAAAMMQQRAMLAGVQSDSKVRVDYNNVPVWMTVG